MFIDTLFPKMYKFELGQLSYIDSGIKDITIETRQS